ncbi:peptidase inhibitor family I36 protein [Streptomyces sp. NBC_01387]|uniref:peptidase inhibitor family I36 protein n=1 Tax=unclassified Streptomyces TaxID=2593676 RepID=UPI002024C83C|nr:MULTISPECIES: peptidase inhibitor family I36 protein [unclassified Streptomyces]MCX4551331.1 peptidase inhibitor family I36 protein [Streptomyces sp. NBC_01500]WSC22715.1 peptidase inhibitor family I36 protein [Streptomyces sp. NBC_01766]WSV56640.1 peptidase inhibitor family I36 protein [Streptomyces sp. NBC_01014]
MNTNNTRPTSNTRPTNAATPTKATRRALLRTTVTAGILTAAVLAPQTSPAAAQPRMGDCATGQLCLWEKGEFKGSRRTYELSGLDIESCTALPKGTAVGSLANRTGRPVTTYQSQECGDTGEFETYPGGGTWLPRSPYQVRAFKIWEN